MQINGLRTADNFGMDASARTVEGEYGMTKADAKAILEEVSVLDDSMYQYSKTYLEALNMAIEALSGPQWIPCSERLPEEDGRYLVTCINRITPHPWVRGTNLDFYGKPYMDMKRFEAGEWQHLLIDDLVAWWPVRLPDEPYTEAST